MEILISEILVSKERFRSFWSTEILVWKILVYGNYGLRKYWYEYEILVWLVWKILKMLFGKFFVRHTSTRLIYIRNVMHCFLRSRSISFGIVGRGHDSKADNELLIFQIETSLAFCFPYRYRTQGKFHHQPLKNVGPDIKLCRPWLSCWAAHWHPCEHCECFRVKLGQRKLAGRR